ncbi:MAG TPA: hypothetical protein VE135_05710 [Pyrinomonadaceae bacterium]|nr:hypothetical protein [Pyrinomonadaceae bacterium]
MLILNDGVVRTKIFDEHEFFCAYFALWFRGVVWAHLDVNEHEKKNGFPGTRTIVTAGERAHYGFDEIRFDDLILNYTRQ